MRRVECSWRFVYILGLLIISEKRWTILTIFVSDSYIDNFRENLNVLDDLCIWYEFMSLCVYDKSLMELTICVYDSSIDNLWEELLILDDLCIF